MLTISGADWFSRRGGTCRLHAIHVNQLRAYMEMAGEIVKRGSAARYPSPGTAGPASQPCDGAIPAHGPDGFSPQDFVALQIFCCRAVISAPWAHDLPGRFPARDLRPAARPRPRR